MRALQFGKSGYMRGRIAAAITLLFLFSLPPGAAEALLKTLAEEFPQSALFAAEYAKVQGRPVAAQWVPAAQ
jgi:hypothetical protein